MRTPKTVSVVYGGGLRRGFVAAQGVTPQLIDQTFSVAWGSQYVNNFLDVDNRIKRVYVQADENVKYGAVLRVMAAARTARRFSARLVPPPAG